jgi:MoxR-like ATPase
MAIPGFQSIMLPLLKIASDESEHNHAEVRDSLGIQFEISDSEKEEMLPSGKQARFSNRVAWAIVYLRRAGLIENSSRGIFHITVQGLDLLKTNPKKIDIKLLKQLNPEIKNWSKPSDQSIESMDIYRFFKDRDEAKWAFDLLKETIDRLGIKEPNDERFAVTCPSGGKALHLNFGQWLVLGFGNQDVGKNRIEIALLADQVNFYNKYESFDFAKGEDNFSIKIYKLPIEQVRPLKGDLRTAYEKSLELIADKFGDWKATPWRKKHHIQEIAESLFNDTKLEALLNSDLQRNIWWVNQGGSIKNERKDGVLCAPARADSSRLIPHWERLMEIKPGDIILHYANGELLYASTSTASAVAENRPYGRFEKVNLVKVDYYELVPSIPLSQFSEELQELSIEDGPINVNGGVKEGYLWRLNPEALKIIQSSQPETKWPNFAILDTESSWIFQANPDIFDIDEAISELKEITWKINRYKDRVHAGDIVYLWKSGENAGIVAVGKILSEPALLKDLEIEKRFIRKKAAGENGDKDFMGVRVSVEHVLGTIIRRQDLLNDPLLGSMQILRQSQGTNFVLNDEEAKAIHDLINSLNSKPKNPEYTLEQCSNETGLDESTLKRWKKAIERKGQAIIYGPPGTGKTFIAEHLAEHLIGGGYGFKETVQFHPAYSYEDFIQGIRPKNRDDGKLEYSLVPGRFLKFCQDAADRQGICVLIIDEINRANLARVFGELMYLLEYRGKGIPLASDGNTFSIPENVRIIGTMNTADRSIALVDNALRRRFVFLRLQPEYGILRRYHEREQTEFPIEKLIQVLKELNEEIGDPHYEIGISYFIRTDLSAQIEDIWTMEIEPYLEEHFFNDADKIRNYRWANVKEKLNL